MRTAFAADLSTWRYWRNLGVHSFAALGFQILVLEAAALLFPKHKILSGTSGLLVVMAVALAYGLWRSWPRPIEQDFNAPKTRISVVSGNLLEQDTHLVIGMTDTFDTSTPKIIAPKSLQAQLVHSVYGGSTDAFAADLEGALSGISGSGIVDKEGNTVRYPLGTVAVIRDKQRALFCIAYTEMNEHNEARGTVDGVWRSLDRLWSSVSKNANGEPVAIPVIGGGMSRLSQVLPSQDAIRTTILSFLLASRSSPICEELRIVVQPKDFNRLDRLELQAFLRSLRPS